MRLKLEPTKVCMGRTEGDFHGTYSCMRRALLGKDYCYWHDPSTQSQRDAIQARKNEDRRLEREYRERYRLARDGNTESA